MSPFRTIGNIYFVGTDPLNPQCWVKQTFPALSNEDGWNGPGHCSVFFDGSADYMAFHTYDEGMTEGWSRVHAVAAPFEMTDGKIKIMCL